MTTQRPERRARTVAWLGLLYSVLLLLAMILIWVATGSQAVFTLFELALPAGAIWFILLLVYHQRVRVQVETFEFEELKAERPGTSAIFDTEDEQLRLARRRLNWMYKWLLPLATIFLIANLTILSLVNWSWRFWEGIEEGAWTGTENVPVVGWGVGLGAFVTFLMSRYVTGMSRYAEWRMLKSGSSYFMGLTLAMVSVTIAVLAGNYYETPVPEQWVTRVLRVLMLVLAAEFLLNLILDFYRPRAAGEEPRPSFDSRLFGLIAEPGGIARSIAEAANYQFGFEISSTWFYKLLERSVAALLGFAVLTLLLASCFVFVEADEVAVIQRFGQKSRIVDSGVWFKLPWPMGQVRKVELSQIHELKVGDVEVKEKEAPKEQFYLWTNEHGGEPHLNVLVATPELKEFITTEGATDTRPAESGTLDNKRYGADFAETGKAVAVSMLRVAVAIQYSIGDTPDDAYRWLTVYQEPEKKIESLATQEITRYCASLDIDSLMGAARGEIEAELTRRIHHALNESKLDFVDIRFLALQGIHPPVDTASAFQEVIGAEQKSAASIRTAEADRNKRLTLVAGTTERAIRLAEAIQEKGRIESDPQATEAQKKAAARRVEELFVGDADKGISPIRGEAAKRVFEARAERWRLENQAYGRSVKFRQERIAKDAAPQVYAMNKYLEALAESMQAIRKYVIGDIGQEPIIQFNWQDSTSVPIDVDLETED